MENKGKHRGGRCIYSFILLWAEVLQTPKYACRCSLPCKNLRGVCGLCLSICQGKFLTWSTEYMSAPMDYPLCFFFLNMATTDRMSSWVHSAKVHMAISDAPLKHNQSWEHGLLLSSLVIHSNSCTQRHHGLMYQTYFVEGIKGCMPIIEPMLTALSATDCIANWKPWKAIENT